MTRAFPLELDLLPLPLIRNSDRQMPPGETPSGSCLGLTSTDEPLFANRLLAHTTVLALLKRLHPERVGVDGLELIWLQKRTKSK